MDTNGNKNCAAEFANTGTAAIAIAQSDWPGKESVECCFCCNFDRMRHNFLLLFLHRLRSAARTTECVFGIPGIVTDCPLPPLLSSWSLTACFGGASVVSRFVVAAIGTGELKAIFFGLGSASSNAASQSTFTC